MQKIADEQQKLFSSVLPTLQENYARQTSKSTFEYFEGPRHVDEFYSHVYDLIANQDPPSSPLYVFGYSYKGVSAIHPAFSQFMQPSKKLDIPIKAIIQESQRSQPDDARSNDLYIVTRYNLSSSQIRYMSDKYSYPGSIVIMSDRVILYDFRNFIYSITVNKNMATTWRMFFEFIWDHLPKV